MGSIPQLSVVRGPSSHLAELASPSSSTSSATRTIDELWSSTCREYTTQVAVRDLSSGLDKIKQFTYEQLEKDANRIARAILQQAKEQPVSEAALSPENNVSYSYKNPGTYSVL